MKSSTVVLGLGSNLGDRLTHLRTALAAIKNVGSLAVKQVSPLYISDAMLPDIAAPEWDIPYLNLAVRCETNLSPTDLLSILKTIEATIGREEKIRWAPRIIDIDILAIDALEIQEATLSIPHEGLLERPFALWPLADVWPTWKYPSKGAQQNKIAAELVEKWGSRYTGDCRFRTRQINQRIDTPVLMGVVNVTPNSFSDGGKFFRADAASQQALYLSYSGAEIIDIGAESTEYNATALTSDEEWARLEPVLNELHRVKNDFLLPPKISIDTRHADVAKKALAYDFVHYINDVTGLQDPAMIDLAVQSQKKCIVMHHLTIPANKAEVLPRSMDVVAHLYDWAQKHFDDLERKGIVRKNIIFDPGIGFGKTAEQSLALIKNIDVFSKLACSILVGHSRKSFISMFSRHMAPERDVETLVCSLYLADKAVDILRVHDVEMCARGIRTWKMLT
jgi:2-amino-4-hydroxy-6-hydroxymethyldihydropteridine diphosphokinase/dihydropteroate synthase